MRTLVFSSIALVWVLGCSPGAGSGSIFGAGATSGRGASGSGETPGANVGGGPGLGVGGGLVGGPQGSGTSGGGGEGGACAELVMQPEQTKVDKTIPGVSCTSNAPEPIVIYIMLDNSGSMKDNNKWTDAVGAITKFVESDPTLMGAPWVCVDKDGNGVPPPSDLPPPGSGSISVGIQYLHPESVGRNPDECDGSAHSTPAVPVGPIPANGGKIVSSLGSTGPNSDTPTVGALTGGTEFCAAYQAANPGKKCVLVLVTDGQPNGCGLSSDCGGGGSRGGGDCVDPASASTLTPIASGAFQNGVITFTVGMSGVTTAGFTLLDQIAVARGSAF